MPLRWRLQHQPETLNEYERAAEERYWDGLDLMASGRGWGGAYLMGYAAEMWLKYAFFRFRGVGPDEPIAKFLGPIKKARPPTAPGVPKDNLHSLWFWTMFLRDERRRVGRSLPPEVDWDLVRWMRRIHQNWLVEMRYHGELAMASEVQTVYSGVSWLRDNRLILWR